MEGGKESAGGMCIDVGTNETILARAVTQDETAGVSAVRSNSLLKLTIKYPSKPH